MKIKELISKLKKCDPDKEVQLIINYEEEAGINTISQAHATEIRVVAQGDDNVSLHADDHMLRLDEGEDYKWLQDTFGV